MFFLIALFAATPAVAAPVQPLPQVLTDPALADQVGQIAGAVTRSLMNVPVGELEAAVEGRRATPTDRARTLGDSIGDPLLERRIADQAAASGRTIQAASQALANSLPAIMQALDGATADIERAIGNLPSPAYPRR